MARAPTRRVADRPGSVASTKRARGSRATRPCGELRAPPGPGRAVESSWFHVTCESAFEQLLVRLLVEADNERAALAHGGGAEVARGAEEQPEQLGASGARVLEVRVDDLLALGHVELVDVLQHAEGGVALDGGLLRVGLRGDGDLALGKEPLRLGAGHSAVAVIAPVDGRHALTPWVLVFR